MTTITNPDAIKIIQMRAARSALNIELKTGLKHSKLNVRKAWAVHMGMKPNTKLQAVIDELTKRIDAADKAFFEAKAKEEQQA